MAKRMARSIAGCMLVMQLTACANVLGIGEGALRDAEGSAPVEEAGASVSGVDAAAPGMDAAQVDAQIERVTDAQQVDAVADADTPPVDAAPMPDAEPGNTCPSDAECCADADCMGHRPCLQNRCADTTCVAGYRACNGQCIPASMCCTREDCGTGLVCNRGMCASNSCGPNEVPCGQGCIGTTQCCVDEDCPGHHACTSASNSCSTTACATGYTSCADQCLGDGQCCGDGDCGGHFACRASRCSSQECAPGYKRCGTSCIANSACCSPSDCANFACNANVCSTTSCGSGYKLCGSACIASSACCGPSDCANFACSANVCSSTTCASGFKRCGSACIPSANCCSDGDCANHFACVSGACSTNTCAPTQCGVTCDMSTSCRPNYMFLSSRTFTLASLGGAAGADSACKQMATAAGLPGTFMAWLGTRSGVYAGSDYDPAVVIHEVAARLMGSSGRMPMGWVRPDKRPFSSDIGTQRVFYPPSMDETGRLLSPDPFESDSVLLGGCNVLQFSTELTLSTGLATTGSQSWWTSGYGFCDRAFRLYCFGVDYRAPLQIEQQTGRKAFEAKGWMPGGGLAGADAFCQQHASAANLSGSFRAVLATSTQSAASRFNIAAGSAPWVRTDGVRLVDKAADFFAPGGMLLAALDVAANGDWARYSSVFTGVGMQGPSAVDATALTCNDWTSTSSDQKAHSGNAAGTRNKDALGWGLNPWYSCADQLAIYCLQQ